MRKGSWRQLILTKVVPPGKALCCASRTLLSSSFQTIDETTNDGAGAATLLLIRPLPAMPAPRNLRATMWSVSYDIIIVGAGVAGCALAHALSVAAVKRNRPLRICLLERSLAEPDRIVGELLQPGGIMALQKLGLEDCVDGIDAIPTYGYCVVLDGAPVHIPYPDGREGRAFHHGRFIQQLRKKAKAAERVDVVEATVSELIECPLTGRILGVRATRKEEGAVEKEAFFADLTIVADGCFSNFRSKVLGKAQYPGVTKGHFCGVILEDAALPIPKHGTVMLVKGYGPVLSYQIGTHETRVLFDVKHPPPSDLKVRRCTCLHFLFAHLSVMPSPSCRSKSCKTSSLNSPPPSISPLKKPSSRTASDACPIRSSRPHSRASRRKRARSSSGTRGTCAIRSRAVA